jgi:acid stress chaperone HdeB
MLMKIRPFLSAVLLAILLPMPANAQLTLDITKVTCRQYLTGGLIPTRSMTLWLSGYFHGKRDATTVDIESIEPNAYKLEDYCGGHQDEAVMKAIEIVFGVK